MTTLKEWVQERQENAPTGSVRIGVSKNETDYLSSDPGEFNRGKETVTPSFEQPESSAFGGSVMVRLSDAYGVEAAALGKGWKPVKGIASFYDGNPSGGTIFYVKVVEYVD